MATSTLPLLRDRFPALDDATYLVSHSMGAPPLGARAALERYWQRWSHEGPEAWNAWLPELDELADNLGRILNAEPQTVSLAPNVSLTQAALASSLDYPPERSDIVVEALQFPTVVYVWKAWEQFGARVVVVPSDDGRTMSTERFCEAITERTRFAVVSHAAYVSGAVVDVAAIQARCREVGALLVLDAYQTTGVYPYDVRALDIDVVVGGSHKWLCGGPGCGFIYVKPALREALVPAITGWMAHESPFAFEAAPIRVASGTRRWYTGTPTVPGYLAARAGHDALLEVGLGAVRAHNVRLTTALAEGALERGFTIPTPLEPARRSGWIGMDFPGADRAVDALVRRRVFVDYRPGCGIRVGPHFYSGDDDVAAFFAALDDVRGSA